MTEAVVKPDLEGLARIIDPPAWLEHDDLIKRAEGWERANADRPDPDFARMAEGRRRDAAELVRMSLAKAEKAWGWVHRAIALQADVHSLNSLVARQNPTREQSLNRLRFGLPYTDNDHG